MKFFIKNLLFLFCICGFSIFIKAQSNTTEPAPLPPKKFQCTSQLFDEAEYYFRARNLRKYYIRAENLIKKILDVCPNADLISYLPKQLEILEEEKAAHNFIVGKYYFKQSTEFKKGGLKGAKSRFLDIIEKYPNYSKTAEVLFLLGEVFLVEKEFEQAKEYFQRLIKQFPQSDFTVRANEKLNSL